MRRRPLHIVHPEPPGMSLPARVILAVGCLTSGFALAAAAVAAVFILIWLGKEVL